MPNLQYKSLRRTNLTACIYAVLYAKSYSKNFLFGLSCVFTSASYAESIDVDPLTEHATEMIAQKTDTTSANIALNDSDTIYNNVDASSLDLAIQQFDNEPVYHLQEADIPTIDQSLANEIYQIAEDAQQEAKLSESTIPPVSQLVTHRDNSEFSPTLSENQTPISVDTLMQDIQSQEVVLPEFQGSEDLVQNIEEQRTLQKRGFFSRLFRRNAVDADEVFKPLPKIKTIINGDNGVLANNIKAKLSTFTIEAFEDFNAALPQIKNMTTQAAEAVGYYQAEYQFQKQDNETLLITLTANDPVFVHSQEIDFTGEGAKRPVFQVVKIVPDLNIDDQFNHAAYETTKLRINKAASDNGYFDSYWDMHDAKVTLPDNIVDINLLFETGERYQLGDVEFRMMDPSQPFPLRESVLKQLAPFKDGDDYTSWRINVLSNNLINSRYFNFALVNEYKPDAIEHKSHLPDERSAIDQENLDGSSTNDLTTDAVSQSVVDENLFAGTDAIEEQKVEEKVADSSGFIISQDESEQLKSTAREDKKVPVIVFLNSDNPNNLETGLGYGTDTGFRLRAQYRRAIVNDRGHSFDSNLELSQKRQSIDGRYMIPYKHPLNDYFSLVGGYEREVRGDIGQGVELDIESGVIGAERVIKRSLGEWQHNMGVRYRLDRINSNGVVDEDDVPDAFKVISTDPEQESLLFGYELSRTSQRNRINPSDRTNPTEGFRQYYRVDVGSESLLTETNMAIINAGWRFIYSLGESADHQFVGRGDLGYIVTDNFDRVPYNLRYFAGGDQSLRGYDYKSLGPKQDNLLIGGQSLAIGSLEYNYQFKDKWRAAVFTDVGNAYDDKFSNETKYGVGVGIRWASPVGPIRLDVAAGVSEESIPIRLHFFIGPAL